jgi:V/A-type H+/Na+-transporting ATPase subunit I
MSLRPARARWFELLAPRAELAWVVETLARTCSVELEIYSDRSVAVNLPHLQEQMAEYHQLAQRYQEYWKHYELKSAMMSGTPAKMLETALARLRRWVAAAGPLVKHIEALQAEHAELLLVESMLTIEVDDRIDYSLLAAAGPSLAVRLFVMPPAYRLTTVTDSLLYCKCSSERHEFLLAAGLPADIEVFHNEIAAQKGRTLTLPEWLHGRRETALGQVRQRQQRIHQVSTRLHRQIDAMARSYKLDSALANISRLEWFLTHVTALPVSDNFAWISGWTSDLEGQRLPQALTAAHAHAIVNYPPAPDGLRPPMVLQNPWWARPFELFAAMLGTPAGDEADPSRLVALLVPLLFGYMFGDVGQGFVLLLTGLFLQQRWPLLRILVANGAASMLFGVVFGSVFGREDVIPALWVHPIAQPLAVLAVPLLAGVLVLLLGLLLNALECWWRGELRRWLQVDAALLVIYLSLLAALFIPGSLTVTVFGFGWYLAGSLGNSGDKPLTRVASALASLVEQLMQLLINSISFVRVGAFALAHAGLSLAFVTMAESTGSVVASLLIMLLGNVIVILLEGLVVTIQTTRLVLFEFFIRFLRGSGRTFRPLLMPQHVIATRE